MKKFIILMFLPILLFSGCKIKDSSDKLKVFTSFYAMYDFTRTIAGDKVDLYLLVPPGTEPHDWEPSTRDMASLERADMLIYSGAGMEQFIGTFKESIKNNDLIFVEASDGIELLQNDPHVWLNPINALKEYENIKNALCAKDPANSELYEANFQLQKDKLNKLDIDYHESAENFKSKDLVVSHEAYGYLCEAYGLNQVAIEGFAADGEPSLAKMIEIINYIRQNDVKYIFT
ncbi:MAG: zinc ABC transporter substrate-binding protein, partial [Clostridiales bacterium]|nr:zinc ABC transporter substrate-binding protein [Clostridiales bacterium]